MPKTTPKRQMHFDMSPEQYSQLKQQTENTPASIVYNDKKQKATVTNVSGDSPAKIRKSIRSLVKETKGPVIKQKKIKDSY
jgi:hypothetical protein